MTIKTNDVVLAHTIDGPVLCTVAGTDYMGRLELIPNNDEVSWAKCWLFAKDCKLVKAAPVLKAVK